MKHKFNILLRVTAVLVLIGIAAGCRSVPSAGITVESYPKNSISVNSKIMGGLFNVTEVVAAKENDLLNAQVTVQNITRRDCQAEYRFEWMDKNGLSITTPMTVWIPVNASAMEKVRMHGVAPNKAAEDFSLIVRFRRASTRWTLRR